jgi:hypothetical protein
MKAQISSTDSTSHEDVTDAALRRKKIKTSWLADATTRLPAMRQREPA